MFNQKEYQKEYRKNNKKRKIQIDREYRKKNKNKAKKYREENRDRLSQLGKEWRENNKEKMKEYKEKNKEHLREISKKYKTDNKDAVKKYNKKYSSRPEVIERENKRKQQKRDTDPMFRLNGNISSNLRGSLKNNNLSKGGRHWENLVGYTKKELKDYLEKLFQHGMDWDNYGHWHIDHIVPLNFFKYNSTNDVEFKYCWSLYNLQPLWATDNISKNDKIIINNKTIRSSLCKGG